MLGASFLSKHSEGLPAQELVGEQGHPLGSLPSGSTSWLAVACNSPGCLYTRPWELVSGSALQKANARTSQTSEYHIRESKRLVSLGAVAPHNGKPPLIDLLFKVTFVSLKFLLSCSLKCMSLTSLPKDGTVPQTSPQVARNLSARVHSQFGPWM